MPMLRPPDLVAVGDQGTVLEQKMGGYWVVRFERGTFLIDARYLISAEEPAANEDLETGSGHTDTPEDTTENG